MSIEVDRDEDEAFVLLAVRLGFLTEPTAEALRSSITSSRDENDSPAKARELVARQGLLTASQIDITEMLLRPHSAIPGYELQGHLGHGGMGVVFQARQLNLDRVVALKTILVSGLGQTDALLRFEREARAVAKLQHPNIVAAYDFGQHGGRLFLAMEYLKGTDVDKWIDTEGPLAEAVVWSLARQAVAGLSHAANAGIIHRDIKPANMLLVDPPEGSNLPLGIPLLKLADFGLARLGDDLDPISRVTRQNTAVGSPHYMAPEQLQGGAVDSRADLYALGASLYHMLTGRPPFDLGNLAQIISLKITTGPKPLQDIAPGFLPETYRIIGSLMELSPDRRPSDFGAIIRDIDDLLSRLPPIEVNEGLWSASNLVPSRDCQTLDQTMVFSKAAVVSPAKPLPDKESLPISTKAFEHTRTVSQPLVTQFSTPVTGPSQTKRQRRKVWLGGAAIVSLALGAIVYRSGLPDATPTQIVRIPMTDPEYSTRLFNGTDLQGWTRRSGAWNCQPDAAMMEGTDGVIEKILLLRSEQDSGKSVPVENFRLQCFIDRQSAIAVELHFGFAWEAQRDGARYVLRLTHGQYEVGECASDTAEFVSRGVAVLDSPAANQPQIVTLEQQPGGWFVKVNGKPEVALPRRDRELSEIRFRVQGGPATFSDIELTQLRIAVR